MSNHTKSQMIPTTSSPPRAGSGLMPAEFIIGMEAPIVLFKQFKKFISVPGGKGVSALAGSAAVLLSAGAFKGRFAVLLYDVSASMNEEAR